VDIKQISSRTRQGKWERLRKKLALLRVTLRYTMRRTHHLWSKKRGNRQIDEEGKRRRSDKERPKPRNQ